MSTRYFTYTNDGSVPGRFLTEFGAGYSREQLGAFKDLKAQFNVYNVLNSQYYASIGTNGFIASEGARVGVPAPTHEMLTRQVLRVERNEIPPRPENVLVNS